MTIFLFSFILSVICFSIPLIRFFKSGHPDIATYIFENGFEEFILFRFCILSGVLFFILSIGFGMIGVLF